ncbi:MAG: tetratricopeptide repeat protein [Magnetococcales bacterium]|nr:tetratricopeptide repeat protein [Magnetococcales bacterium]
MIQELLQRAVQYHAAGRLAEAQSLYREILDHHPDHPEALHFLGIVAHQKGRDDLALPLIERSLTVKPDNPGALNTLGIVLGRLNRDVEAVIHYRRSLALHADQAEVHGNLGMALARLGRFDEALENLKLGVLLAPDIAGHHVNLGNFYMMARCLEEAVSCYHRAVTLQPGMIEAHANLGNALVEIGREEEGIVHLRQSITLDPTAPQGYHNLGNAWQKQGRPDLALPYYRQAVRLQPDCPDTLFNEGLSHLQLGAFREGWAGYEWRWRTRGFIPHGFTAPQWDGRAFPGQTLLIHCEQGFGDSLQFIRFVPQVKARGGRVVVCCPPALERLFSRIAGIDRLVGDVADVGLFDWQIPLLSLPRVLDITLESLPGGRAYLTADGGLGRTYREWLAPLSGLKIGISWRGDPRHGNDRRRSMTAAALAAGLATVPGRLVGLQKDATPEEVALFARRGGGWLDASGWLHDFDHTAALVVHLDLVIAVDTAVVHLAGGLGRPVWLLLPKVADWRWFLDREESPWYPGMRLLRQRVAGDWAELLHRVAWALEHEWDRA